MKIILEDYSELFDVYLAKGELPEYAQGDVLAKYIKDVLDDPGNHHLCTTDPVWKDLLKSSLLDFFRQLLSHMMELEKEEAKEKKYMSNFQRADIKGKRLMWPLMEEDIQRLYPPSEVNLEGYVQLMKENKIPKDLIFDALVSDWYEACEKRIAKDKQRLLDTYKADYENQAKLAGNEDYKTIKNTEAVLFKYPALKEILRMMGREKEMNTKEEDSTLTRYIPLLLAHSKSKEEIEGIRTGDDLNTLLPTEVAWLSDPKTELFFFQKFASKQLQLFASKPPSIQQKKTEQKTQKKPRLQEGPMIICLDTSSSMMGRPERISKSMVMQILQTAKRKNRKCFLITYSVHAKALDISKPEHWSKVKLFLKNQFTGGTDGEYMLAFALDALKTDNYSMADVLIISDFEFNLPLSTTRKRMEEEQEKGTRFYGLQIGKVHSGYDKVLDRIWSI